MRKTLFSALLLAVAFTACQKDDKKTSPAEADIIINGITDMTVWTDSVVWAPLSIGHNNNNQEKTDLFVNDLPANVTASFEPAGGIPDFGTLLSIRADYMAEPGTYPIKIGGKTASGKSKSYEVNLTIKGGCDVFAGKYAAHYYSYEFGAPVLADNIIEIKKDPNDVDKFIITDLLYDGQSFTATRNCKYKVLNIVSTQVTTGALSGFWMESYSDSFDQPYKKITAVMRKGSQTYVYTVDLTVQ